MAEKEIRLCKNIAKFSQNFLFQLAKFCILDAKFEICFCKKPRGQVRALGQQYCCDLLLAPDSEITRVG